MNREAAELAQPELLRNLDIADKLGCLGAEGMATHSEAAIPGAE